jgi:hypothetical protein
VKKTIIALTLVIAIALTLAVTIPAFATGTGTTTAHETTTITGTVAQAIEVTAPTTSGFGTFSNGANALTTTAGDVKCNFNWQLVVRDANQGTNKGHMISGSNFLAAELLIGATIGGTSLPSPLTAGAADGVTISTGVPTAATAINFGASQTVAQWTDAAGLYTITIDFVGSAR